MKKYQNKFRLNNKNIWNKYALNNVIIFKLNNKIISKTNMG